MRKVNLGSGEFDLGWRDGLSADIRYHDHGDRSCGQAEQNTDMMTRANGLSFHLLTVHGQSSEYSIRVARTPLGSSRFAASSFALECHHSLGPRPR